MTDITDQQVNEIKAMKISAKTYLKEVWPFTSGTIRGSIDLKNLPQRAVDAMNELDELSTKVDTLTDQEIGRGLGLWIQLQISLVRDAIRQFAPEILPMLML